MRLKKLKKKLLMVNDLQLQETNEQDFKLFSKVLQEVKYMPFKKFDMEFVAEDGKILFTDLTIDSRQDSLYAQELAKEMLSKEKNKKNKKSKKQKKLYKYEEDV